MYINVYTYIYGYMCICFVWCCYMRACTCTCKMYMCMCMYTHMQGSLHVSRCAARKPATALFKITWKNWRAVRSPGTSKGETAEDDKAYENISRFPVGISRRISN